MAFAMTFVVISVFISYRRSKNRDILWLIGFLGSAGVYAYIQSLSYYLSGGDPEVVAVGLTTSVFFVYTVQLSAFFTTFFKANNITRRIQPFAVSYIIISGGISLYFLATHNGLPTFHESGFTFWNGDPLGIWILAINGFLLGNLWGYVLFKSSYEVESRINKWKAWVLAYDGVAWGFATFLYFPAQSVPPIVVAFALALSSFFATMIVFLIARIQERKKRSIQDEELPHLTQT